MLKRTVVALLCVPLLLWVLFFTPPIVLPIAVSIVSMIGVHEVLWSTGFVKNVAISGLSLLFTAAVPFWVYIGEGKRSALVAVFLFFSLMFLIAISSHYTVTMEKMGGSFFFSAFIPYFLSSFIRLDTLTMGKYYILIPFLAAYGSDIFALFTGMALGRHKLAPELSPNKTVEGALGGVAGGVLFCLIYAVILNRGFHLEVNYFIMALYGLLGAPVSQLGDLSFSYIKRQYGLKDFGNIFPGHGGVLDRFDSVIFAAPFLEIMIQFLPAIG